MKNNRSKLYLLLVCFSLCTAHAMAQNTVDTTIGVDEDIYLDAEQKPQFIGDIKDYFANAISSPANTKSVGIKVVTGFIINKQGYVSHVKILSSSGSAKLDSLVVKVENKMPRWKPAIDNGKAVNFYYKLPVTVNFTSADLEQENTTIQNTLGKDSIYDVVDTAAHFKGSLNYFLANHINYPEVAREHNIEGKVLVSFTIEKDGRIINIQIEKSSGNAHLDYEALRFVKIMPNWIPAYSKGIPVQSHFRLPITFELEGNGPSRRR